MCKILINYVKIRFYFFREWRVMVYFKSISFLLIILFFLGCSGKEYQLFENNNSELISNEQDINISYDSKIIVDDILGIDIYNMNQKSNIFKKSITTEATNPQNNEYIVSENGTIYLPLLQEISVIGYTANNLSKYITEQYRKYLKQPYVKVAIKNHKVFVLGEVKKEGSVPLKGSSISILEAISYTGGLTDYAARNKIRIISKEAGKYKMRTLDMSKLSTLNIENLMLKNNSIVYVQPRDGKATSIAIRDYMPILQVISSIATTLLAFDYITVNNGAQ